MKGLRALHGAVPGEDGEAQGEDGAASGEDVAKVLKELRDALPGELVEALEAKASVRESKLIDALEEKASARASKLIGTLEEKAGARESKLIDALEAKAGARESKLIDALEEKAGAREGKLLQAVAKLGRLTRKHVAISSGLGALVGSLILAVPLLLLPAHSRPVPHSLTVVAGAGPNGTRAIVQFDTESLLAVKWGEKPLDQPIPVFTLPGQRVAPCEEGVGQEVINGNCWTYIWAVKPPCGRLFRHGDKCYAPIAADPKRPVEPDR